MSFTLTFNGQTKRFDKKVKLLSLIEDPEKNYICCLVNNRVRELTYEVYYDAEIQFLTLKDQDAIKTYETSMRYLVAMAFHRVFPKLKVRFCYNVSRSIFIELLDKNVRCDVAIIRKVDEEMRKIVESNYEFKRLICTKEEGAKIYKKWGYKERIEILKYRPEKTVHFYECNGYYNYMYGRMVPSSGYLKKWRMRLYSPGILLQYPRYECNGEIPEFVDAPMFGKTLKESHKWAKIAGADSVYKINKLVETNGEVDFVNMCEARHNRMLCDLGAMIEKEIDSVRLICVAGPSSSGKTTFANRLRIELLSRGINPIRISLDDYYLPKNEVPKDENGEPDLEAIGALDIELFNQNMLDLINGEEITLPKFDFQLGKRVEGRKLKIGFDQPIIIEGIHALNEQMTFNIPKHQKFKIYIAPQAQINIDPHNPISLTDLRLLRRMVRDYKFRNSSAEETFSMWPSVRRGEFRWIYDTQEEADYVFNSMLSYELCVMKKYAMPLLTKIERDSEYFPVAERLMRLLKYFDDLGDEWVPCNSLMREFIGGSCYKDV